MKRYLAPLLIALVVIALYGPLAADAEFVQDDVPAFLQHPAVQWPVDLGKIARAPYFGDPDHAYIQLSRPLATLSFALEKGAGTDSSPARHCTDVLLYALACAWLTTLAQRLAKLWQLRDQVWPVAIAGLWFALHPAHAEVVMQVAYRPELLALLFELAAFEVLLLVRQNRARWFHVFLGTLAFAAALWSKEQPLMLLPLAILWALARPGLLQRFLPILVSWLVVAIAWLLWRRWLFGPMTALPISEADNPLAVVTPGVRVMSALAIALRGFDHLILPVDLAPDYTFNAWPPITQVNAQVVKGALILAFLSYAVISLWRRARQNLPSPEYDLQPSELGLLGVAWALLTWLPVSNLMFVSTTLYADRLLFAPSVALCLGVPLMFASPKMPVLPMIRWPVKAAVLAAALTLLAMGTYSNASAWTNELSLYTRGVKLQPQSMRMNHNLAFVLANQGRLADARIFQQAALRIRPTDLDVLSLGLHLARNEHRCQDGVPLVQTLAKIPKPAVLARRIALDWAMACHAWQDGWLAVRLLPPQRLEGRQPLDVFALGIAAGKESEAIAWAAPLQKAPWQNRAWTAAGVAGAEMAGRPLEALQDLLAAAHADPWTPEYAKAVQDLVDRHLDHPDADKMRQAIEHARGQKIMDRGSEKPRLNGQD
jgi:hypothetical protein